MEQSRQLYRWNFWSLILLCGMLFSGTCQPAYSTPYFAATYGGGRAHQIIATSDGNFLLVGQTDNLPGTLQDIVIMKMAPDGGVLWRKTLGGANYDRARAVTTTSDGGYVLAGETTSFGAGQQDVWMIKVDFNGNLVWQKTIGTSGREYARSVRATADGGFLVVGESNIVDDNDDLYVLKINAHGDLVWHRIISSCGTEAAHAVLERPGGGMLVVGYNAMAFEFNPWVIALDQDSNIAWQQVYEGLEGHFATAAATKDGYLLAGYGSSLLEIWALKLDFNGNILWQKSYQTAEWSEVQAISPANDNQAVMVGYTSEKEEDGVLHIKKWIVKVNEQGELLWQKTYGDSSFGFYDVIETHDGSLLAVGEDFSVVNVTAQGETPNCGLAQESPHPLVSETHESTFTTQSQLQDIAATVTVPNVTLQQSSMAPNYQCEPVNIPTVGDLNGDGHINIFDLQLLINCIFGSGSCTNGDLNGDGNHNIFDLQQLINKIFE